MVIGRPVSEFYQSPCLGSWVRIDIVGERGSIRDKMMLAGCPSLGALLHTKLNALRYKDSVALVGHRRKEEVVTRTSGPVPDIERDLMIMSLSISCR